MEIQELVQRVKTGRLKQAWISYQNAEQAHQIGSQVAEDALIKAAQALETVDRLTAELQLAESSSEAAQTEYLQSSGEVLRSGNEKAKTATLVMGICRELLSKEITWNEVESYVRSIGLTPPEEEQVLSSVSEVPEVPSVPEPAVGEDLPEWLTSSAQEAPQLPEVPHEELPQTNDLRDLDVPPFMRERMRISDVHTIPPSVPLPEVPEQAEEVPVHQGLPPVARPATTQPFHQPRHQKGALEQIWDGFRGKKQ